MAERVGAGAVTPFSCSREDRNASSAPEVLAKPAPRPFESASGTACSPPASLCDEPPDTAESARCCRLCETPANPQPEKPRTAVATPGCTGLTAASFGAALLCTEPTVFAGSLPEACSARAAIISIRDRHVEVPQMEAPPEGMVVRMVITGPLLQTLLLTALPALWKVYCGVYTLSAQASTTTVTSRRGPTVWVGRLGWWPPAKALFEGPRARLSEFGAHCARHIASVSICDCQ